MRYLSIFLAAALVGPGAAIADTAYVKPSSFEGTLNKPLTIDVSFSDECCEPSYPVKTDTYVIINPDGTRVSPNRIEPFAVKTVLEHQPTQIGTTRISTGERLGRKGEYIRLDGDYHLVNSPDAELQAIPAGTPILTSQTATVTDAYVSIGTPNWTAAKAHIGRLIIEPITHPNLLKAGDTFKGRVLFDGEPLARHNMILTSEAQRLFGQEGITFQTDELGYFATQIDDQGIIVIMVRKQAKSPSGASTDIRSYTTALTLSAGASN